MSAFLANALLEVPEITLSSKANKEPPAPAPPPQHQYQSVSICAMLPGVRTAVVSVEQALAAAAPLRHWNHPRIFFLCRMLLAVEAQTGHTFSTAELFVVFNRWYEAGLRTGELDPAKTRDMYLTKFMTARAKAQKPVGHLLDFDALIAELNTRPLPPEADLFESEPPRLLVGLCKLLQERAGDAPFFLSCRKAGLAIGVKHTIAALYLSAMVGAGLLTVVSQGVGFRASRYRFNPQFT